MPANCRTWQLHKFLGDMADRGESYRERIVGCVHSKALQFAKFIFNKETKEVLGRTCKSWAQILLFFLVFYSALGGLFTVHMAIFVAITPQPAEDIKPWNFGRYAYPNYPNAKIGFISLPHTITYDNGRAALSGDDKAAIEKLLESAELSGVSSDCQNAGTDYGYDVGRPCVFIRISKALDWLPELINSSLAEATVLPVSCTGVPSGSGVVLTEKTAGVPLNISNNNNHRSYPYRGQANFTTPIMSVMIDFSGATPVSGDSDYSFEVTCSLVGHTLTVGSDILEPNAPSWYEAPSNSVIKINVKL